MQTINLDDIPGEKFLSGSHTRVLIGAQSDIQAKNFVSGFVIIQPDGMVPPHYRMSFASSIISSHTSHSMLYG